MPINCRLKRNRGKAQCRRKIRRIRRVGNVKYYNGTPFYYSSKHRTKGEAKTQAKQWKRMGHKSRVVRRQGEWQTFRDKY